MAIGQPFERNASLKLKPLVGNPHRDAHRMYLMRQRNGVAVAAESAHGVLTRRREVELVVRRRSFYRNEGFEAGMLPERLRDGCRCRRKNTDTRNVSLEAVCNIE